MSANGEPRPSPLKIIQHAPAFAGLPERVQHELARASRVRRVERGQLLFSQDDPAEAVYLVVSGRIAITLVTPDGRELVINDMQPGDLFGELAWLQDRKRTASAVAREPSEVVCIPGPVFLAQLDTDPQLMRQLLHTVAKRLRSSSERESALAFLTAPARVARLLLEGAQAAGSLPDLLTISQEEIGQRTGLTRQTVAKILGGWRRAGWIVTGRGRIMLINRAALRRLAQESPP
jgi:CRP/FNR family transcriptional regulator, cyclic AMP receptor protein